MKPGTVHLVGTGPGDPGLMTVRAVELIAQADVIVHDRLIPPGCLRLARPDAQLINVGKEGGGPSTPQDRINDLLVEHGLAGRMVVRLKGGDPFVFGRGGEEALRLKEEGVPFSVVPGVTSGIAAPGTAGIPVTQRRMASAVALVTGHEDPGKGETSLDYEALARFPGTLVLYMGVKRLGSIAEQLIAAGRAADEPAAIIERGTLPDQRTVTATLDRLADEAEAAGIRAPAITLIGEVASLHGSLSPDEPPVLAGRRIAVTRSRAQAGSLARMLADLGATPIEVPAIRIEPLNPDEPLDPRGFDLLCLTSTNSVGLLFGRMAEAGLDARALAGVKVAAIGPGTAAVLRDHGIVADICPKRSIADSLLEELEEGDFERALIVRSESAREVLPEGLRDRGVQVKIENLYRTVAEELGDAERAALAEVDTITFTSASTVRFLVEAVGGAEELMKATGSRPMLASIGPVTSAELRRFGLEPDIEAPAHDIAGLVDALVAEAAG